MVVVMILEGMPPAAVKRVAQAMDEMVAAEARCGVAMEVVAMVGQGGNAEARGGQAAREAAVAVAQVVGVAVGKKAAKTEEEGEMAAAVVVTMAVVVVTSAVVATAAASVCGARGA